MLELDLGISKQPVRDGELHGKWAWYRLVPERLNALRGALDPDPVNAR